MPTIGRVTRPILIQGRPLAGGRIPAICAPLVGRTTEELAQETSAVAAKGPDLLEWRVDFFEAIASTDDVLSAASAIHGAARGIPILFTRRSRFEGGQPIPLDEAQVVDLYRAVCAEGSIHLADFEMARESAHVQAVREVCNANGVGLVLSFHNFQRTPPLAELLDRFQLAERLGADVAKVAVMPEREEDVLRLLEATAAASRACAIPVVSMSMGGWGALSRIGGGLFGSALTFAVGARSSAPGQMPIDDVRAALGVLERAVNPA